MFALRCTWELTAREVMGRPRGESDVLQLTISARSGCHMRWRLWLWWLRASVASVHASCHGAIFSQILSASVRAHVLLRVVFIPILIPRSWAKCPPEPFYLILESVCSLVVCVGAGWAVPSGSIERDDCPWFKALNLSEPLAL